MAPLTLRVAGLHDVPRIVALVESAYRGEASRAGWTTEAGFLDGQRTDAAEVAALVQGPKTVLLLAEREGELVGSVMLRDDGDAASLGMLSVAPSLQASGVGRLLLEACEARARGELHRDRLRLTVITLRTELIAWYERRGFRRTGMHEPFPYGDARYGLPRREDLEFEVMEKELPGG
jgi:ribosomal protein S18 acetylase RimI-like enzyme